MRVVLAIVLAIGLLAAVSPAVEDARRDRALGAVEGDVLAIESVARSLAATDERTGPDATGARRIVTVRIPPASPTSASVRYVAIGAVPGRTVADTGAGDVVAVAVHGRPPRVVRLDADLRVDGRDDRALTLREVGTHRLVLTPMADGDTVSVQRASDGETIQSPAVAGLPKPRVQMR